MYRIKMATMSMCAAIIMVFTSAAQPVSAQVSLQQGLVNVTVQDIDIELNDVIDVNNNQVTVQALVNVVAQVCGIPVSVAVLAQQIFRQGGFTCDVTDSGIRTVLTATQTRGPR